MAIFTLARDFNGQGDGVNGQSAGSDIDFSCVVRANHIRSSIFDRCSRRLRRQDGSLTVCCLYLRLPDKLIVVLERSVLRCVRQAKIRVRRQSECAQVVANDLARTVDNYMRVCICTVAACDAADSRILLVSCRIGHAAHGVECILVVADCCQGNHLIGTDTIR